MKDVFDSTESDLGATWKQNDQLLEAKLKHEIKCCVLLSHECINNTVQDKIKRIQRDSIEIQEGMQKQINILENDTSPNKQKVVEINNNVIAPGMYKVNNTKKHEANTNKAKSVLSSIGLQAASSVRGPSNRDSSFKNSALSNTKKSSERVEASDSTNKKLNVASKNVVLNKKIVTNADVKNTLKAKDVLCVSCA
ncbi:hypothetical protein Tco_0844188 [Tanacetum coccineum]